MRAGNLARSIITIEEPITSRDEYGSQQVSWKEVITTRAQVIYTKGNRHSDELEVYYDHNPIFKVRHYHNINEYMRIKYEGKYYRLLSIQKDIQVTTLITELVNE